MTTVYRLNLESQDNGSSSSDELHVGYGDVIKVKGLF